jgi:DNA polymerase III psi subunit
LVKFYISQKNKNNILGYTHFKEKIVEVSPVSAALEHAEGKNARGVAVVAQITQETAQEELNLLSKILQSVNLDTKNDILLWKGAQVPPINAVDLCRQTGSNKILIFGAPPARLGLRLRVQAYEPFSIGGIEGLWSHSLAELEKDKERKIALWNGLKTLFNKND